MHGRRRSASRLAGPEPQPSVFPNNVASAGGELMGRRCSNLTSVYEVMSRRTQHYEQEIQDFEVRSPLPSGIIRSAEHEVFAEQARHQPQQLASHHHSLARGEVRIGGMCFIVVLLANNGRSASSTQPLAVPTPSGRRSWNDHAAY